jgi:23S rRNA pseudouridine2604 synthase
VTEGTRINKFLADAGVCSRREADRRVEEGRVQIARVDAPELRKKAQAGDRVLAGDRVFLDGVEVVVKTEKTYLAYHKPRGVECTEDDENPDNLVAAVDWPTRVFSVGRLDKYSEGLILLTDDGSIVNELLKGQNGVEKDYHVALNDEISDADIARLEKGVEILDRQTLPCRIRRVGPRQVKFTLVEGINRQIRRMLETVGLRAQRIVRVRIGTLTLGSLEPGKLRPVAREDIDRLLSLKHRV